MEQEEMIKLNFSYLQTENIEMLHDLGDKVAYCFRNHEGLSDSQETHHGTYCIMGIKMQSQ